MATTYAVTVIDNVIDETHTDIGPFATIGEAKDRAEELLRRIYADAPADLAAEVAGVIDALVSRIHGHRGPVTEYDPYLDCTVEVSPR